jgi:hypothetical protein
MTGGLKESSRRGAATSLDPAQATPSPLLDQEFVAGFDLLEDLASTLIDPARIRFQTFELGLKDQKPQFNRQKFL